MVEQYRKLAPVTADNRTASGINSTQDATAETPSHALLISHDANHIGSGIEKLD